MTDDPDVAEDWFTRFEGAGFDGVMAKPTDQPYQQDKRVMWKVKLAERTADCVVAGFRWHKDGEGIGSLLLGLFDDDGTLHHVGVAGSSLLLVAASSSTSWRSSARVRSTRTRRASGDRRRRRQGVGALPGGVSRWNTQKDLPWEPLRLSWWPRFAMSTCSADGSAMADGSFTSGPIAPRTRAPTRSWRRSHRPSWPTSSTCPGDRSDARSNAKTQGSTMGCRLPGGSARSGSTA